jgi:TPR repeat protein
MATGIGKRRNHTSRNTGTKREHEVSSEDISSEKLYQLALAMARRGRGQHTDRVVPILQAAAGRGHPMAAHALAIWHIRGIGVRKNFAKAVALEKIAARAGISEALYNLGFAHETGRGAQRDRRKAFRYYVRAARLRDAAATYEVGRCLFYGLGTTRNERLGKRWIARAKARGYRE